MEEAARAREAALAQRQDQLQRARRQLDVLVGRYPTGDLDAGSPVDGIRVIEEKLKAVYKALGAGWDATEAAVARRDAP